MAQATQMNQDSQASQLAIQDNERLRAAADSALGRLLCLPESLVYQVRQPGLLPACGISPVLWPFFHGPLFRGPTNSSACRCLPPTSQEGCYPSAGGRGPTEPEANSACRAVGVRATLCTVAEEPVACGWSRSLDLFILTCLAWAGYEGTR